MFGQNFDSSNLSAISESLQRTEALSDAEREDFFNAIHNVQLNTTNAYNTLLDIAVAADDPEMIQTVGGLVDRSYRQQGFTQAAYADQFPAQADAMAVGRQDYIDSIGGKVPQYLTFADLEVPTVPAEILDVTDSGEVVTGTDVADSSADVSIEVVTESEDEKPDFEKLFNDLVPDMGNCSTIGGELIRAFNKLEYRFFNDGDTIGFGYGNETCNAPARFLMQETNAEIKNLIEEHWGLDGDNDDAEYRQFIETLKTKIVDFVLDNKLDKVPNYKNLDYLDFYEKEDSEASYDDYEDESDEALKGKELHTPYRKAEDEEVIPDDSESDLSDIDDVEIDSEALDAIVEDAEDGISDLIEDTEVHELAPAVDDIVINKENPQEKGKILNVHDDNTVDIKWDNDDITRNTSVDDVQVINPVDEYKYKIYYIKENKPVKVIETKDPNRAIAVYNGIKVKIPNTECFYIKSSKEEEDLLNKYNCGKVINEEIVINDSNSAILEKLQEELKNVYTTEIVDGQLICSDVKENKAIVLCSLEQPFEISVQIEMVDGDTSEMINYLYDGIAPTADFIAAAFSGEVAARDVVDESKNESHDKYIVNKIDRTIRILSAKGFTRASLRKSQEPLFEILKDSKIEFTDDQAAEITRQLINSDKPVDAILREVIAPESNESVDVAKHDECGTVADLGCAPILPASNGKGLAKAVIVKKDDSETKRLMEIIQKNESLETETDKAALAQELKQVQAATGQDLISIIDFLTEAEFRNISQVFGTADSEEIANEIEGISECKESKKSVLDPTKDFIVVAPSPIEEYTDELILVLNSEEKDQILVKLDNSYDKDEIRKVAKDYFTGVDVDNLAIKIVESKNEDSANFMQFIVDAVNAVDGFTAELDNKQGIHITSKDKKASAFYDPTSRNVIAVYPTENGEFTNAEIELKDPKEVANQLLKPLTEALNPSGYTPTTALSAKAQLTPEQTMELEKADPINNKIQQEIIYANQNIPNIKEEIKEISDDKGVGFIPLEPVKSDLNQEVFTAAVLAVNDAFKLTDNIDMFTKLQTLYPETESKQLARQIKEAKNTGNTGNLIKYLYESAIKSPSERALAKVLAECGQDAYDSLVALTEDFNLRKAKDVCLFKEQAKLIVDPKYVDEFLESYINEDTFTNPILNDANNDVNVKRANGQPMATTNASGNDPVTPTLADDIDPAQVVVDGIPADQSEIDAVTGKDPVNVEDKEPDFDITQQV